MQSAHCCAIFDVFIFIPASAPRQQAAERSRWIFNSFFSPIHRVFAGVSLHGFIQSSRLALLLCAFDVHEMQFLGMQHKKKTGGKTRGKQ